MQCLVWWLAALGVLVAAGGLAWAIYTWRMEHVTRLKVTIEPTIRFIRSAGERDSDPDCYSIVARNLSHHPVGLEWPWLEVHSESPPIRINIMSFHPECEIPGEVAPKAKALCWVPKAEAEAMGLLGASVVAAVPSAEGKVYRSAPTTLTSSSWELGYY
jgi:hypothetical protein